MNKKLSIVLNILLTLAGLGCIGYCAYQMSFALFVKDYGHLATHLLLALACVYVAGTAIARLVRMWKKRKA